MTKFIKGVLVCSFISAQAMAEQALELQLSQELELTDRKQVVRDDQMVVDKEKVEEVLLNYNRALYESEALKSQIIDMRMEIKALKNMRCI